MAAAWLWYLPTAHLANGQIPGERTMSSPLLLSNHDGVEHPSIRSTKRFILACRNDEHDGYDSER